MTLEPGHSRREGEEQAALYVLGILTAAEADAFEAHLDQGCAQCEECVRTMEWTSRQLGLAEAISPPPDLRARLLASLVASPVASGVSPVGGEDAPSQGTPTNGKAGGASRLTVRSKDTPWEASGFPGITVRRLHTDRAQGRQTMLVRMEAGASYFPHRHEGEEESFVLEGDVTADGETLAAGDYHRAAAGSVHGVQTTKAGCLLLIISSVTDEILVEARP